MLRKRPLFVSWLLIQTSLATAQGAPLARKIFSSDSVSVVFPTISPDEKWLVFTTFVSNETTRLMIQPLSGGSPRELPLMKGWHVRPRFTPAGDQLLFTSTIPRRGPTDYEGYLVSAPFDTRNGSLTAPPRQVSLDGMRGGMGLAISPDGRWVAYVGTSSNAIKLIPVSGGTARTLAEPQIFPVSLEWSADGRFLSYEVAEGNGFARMRVSREGGASRVVVRSSERLGFPSPDGRYSFTIRGDRSDWSLLKLFDANGRVLGETGSWTTLASDQLEGMRKHRRAPPVIELPPHLSEISTFVASGKYILGSSRDAVASIKVVPVAGGSIQQVSSGTSFEWPSGWSPDGELVYVRREDQSHQVFTRNGKLLVQITIAKDRSSLGFLDGYLIYAADNATTPVSWRLMARSLKDGSSKELAQHVLRSPCCDPVGPGGMHYGVSGGEVYYRQLHLDRVQLRAIRIGGESRLIGEIPAGAVGRTAVFRNRIVFREPTRDSIRLRLISGVGLRAKTLATFGGAADIEFAWSHDGGQLAVGAGSPRTLSIYRFDAGGGLQGSRQAITLPFQYWYEISWVPDGSGLTMIAQPRGAAVTEVALVKLADPQHPILLTKADPANKWGYALSPDGKYVAYSSEQLKGSSIYLIDFAELVKQVKARNAELLKQVKARK